MLSVAACVLEGYENFSDDDEAFINSPEPTASNFKSA